MVIVCDTREHEGKNDHILKYFDDKKIPWVKKKLDYGDYSCYLPKNLELGIIRDLWFDRKIVLERTASLDESAKNCTAERDRIKNEFVQAPENKVLMIENASYSDMIQGNYHSDYSPKSYYGTIHSFWHKYRLPVMFIPDPAYSGMFIRGYLQYFIRGMIR